jgi:putative transcriptional regulator
MITVRVKEVLARRGMTQVELACAVGITPANLNILLQGKAKGVKFSTLDKICTVLGVTVGDVLEYAAEQSLGISGPSANSADNAGLAQTTISSSRANGGES